MKIFSRTAEPISTKHDTKYSWVKGVQICSNKGPCILLRGDNSHIEKIHWWLLKFFFSRTTWVSFVYYFKFRWSLSDKPYMTENVIFFTHIWPQRVKWKFRILTAHLQYMTNQILEYQLSTSCRCSSSDKLYRKKKSFFDPHLTPRDKIKIPKPYCASIGHGQSSPRIP